jgi:hypothetical protein
MLQRSMKDRQRTEAVLCQRRARLLFVAKTILTALTKTNAQTKTCRHTNRKACMFKFIQLFVKQPAEQE